MSERTRERYDEEGYGKRKKGDIENKFLHFAKQVLGTNACFIVTIVYKIFIDVCMNRM